MAVSNTIGSNVFDILVGLGIPWGLQTMVISYGSTVSSSRLHRNPDKPGTGALQGLMPVLALFRLRPHCPLLLGTLAPTLHRGIQSSLGGAYRRQPVFAQHSQGFILCLCPRAHLSSPRLCPPMSRHLNPWSHAHRGPPHGTPAPRTDGALSSPDVILQQAK